MTSISVVIPAYNAESFLAEAIASALAQSPPVSEVVVVDDGSTDDTASLAASFGPPVIVVRQDNRGIGAARNAGVAVAHGDYLAFLDADDIWPDGRLCQLLAALLDSDNDAVFGSVVEFGEGLADSEPVFGSLAGSMLIRRSSFERVGLFREDLNLGEFIDWYGRAADAGLRFANIPEVVLRRRLHESNTGRLQRDARPDYVNVLRAALHRRREAERGG